MSINDIIRKCLEQSDGDITTDELMNYQLRIKEGYLSKPVNEIILNTTTKDIELSFDPKNVFKLDDNITLKKIDGEFVLYDEKEQCIIPRLNNILSIADFNEKMNSMLKLMRRW